MPEGLPPLLEPKDCENLILYRKITSQNPHVTVDEGRHQVIKWYYRSHLNRSLDRQIMDTIKGIFQNRFRINYSCYNRLRNIETNKKIPWLEEGMKSPWFHNLGEARGWIQRQERVRLKNETFTRPNTKYVLDSYTSVDIKLIVGEGRLPEWLRTKKDLYTLDTVNYNFRVSLFAWQCIEERTKRII